MRSIHDYIAEENPAAAMRVAEGIYERVHQLRDHPESGYRYEQSNRHVRILLYGHYRIAYEVDSERDVTILGVFHAALDIARYAL